MTAWSPAPSKAFARTWTVCNDWICNFNKQDYCHNYIKRRPIGEVNSSMPHQYKNTARPQISSCWTLTTIFLVRQRTIGYWKRNRKNIVRKFSNFKMNKNNNRFKIKSRQRRRSHSSRLNKHSKRSKFNLKIQIRLRRAARRRSLQSHQRRTQKKTKIKMKIRVTVLKKISTTWCKSVMRFITTWRADHDRLTRRLSTRSQWWKACLHRRRRKRRRMILNILHNKRQLRNKMQ